jgi:hypothetical protein
MASERKIPKCNHQHAIVDLQTIADKVLKPIPKLELLPNDRRAQLIIDLAQAIASSVIGVREKRADIKASYRRKVYLACDVACSMRRAQLPVTYSAPNPGEGKVDSPYVAVLKAAGRAAGLRIPVRPYKLMQDARCGVLSMSGIALDAELP